MHEIEAAIARNKLLIDRIETLILSLEPVDGNQVRDQAIANLKGAMLADIRNLRCHTRQIANWLSRELHPHG